MKSCNPKWQNNSAQQTEVSRGSDHALSELVNINDPGVAEIAQLNKRHGMRLCQENILWFQITVDDSLRVEVLESEHDLDHEEGSTSLVQTSLRGVEDHLQHVAVHPLHHDKQFTVCFKRVLEGESHVRIEEI